MDGGSRWDEEAILRHKVRPQPIATAMAGNRTASYAGEVFGIGAPARLIEAAAAGAGPGHIMADRL